MEKTNHFGTGDKRMLLGVSAPESGDPNMLTRMRRKCVSNFRVWATDDLVSVRQMALVLCHAALWRSNPTLPPAQVRAIIDVAPTNHRVLVRGLGAILEAPDFEAYFDARAIEVHEEIRQWLFSELEQKTAAPVSPHRSQILRELTTTGKVERAFSNLERGGYNLATDSCKELNWWQTFLASVIGRGATAALVVRGMGGVLAQRWLERHKNDLSKELESYKDTLERKRKRIDAELGHCTYINKSQFDTEYGALKDCFAALGKLRLSFNGMRPFLDWTRLTRTTRRRWHWRG